MSRVFPERRITQSTGQILRPEERMLDAFERQSPSLYFQQAQKRAKWLLVTLVAATVGILYLLAVWYEATQ